MAKKQKNIYKLDSKLLKENLNFTSSNLNYFKVEHDLELIKLYHSFDFDQERNWFN